MLRWTFQSEWLGLVDLIGSIYSHAWALGGFILKSRSIFTWLDYWNNWSIGTLGSFLVKTKVIYSSRKIVFLDLRFWKERFCSEIKSYKNLKCNKENKTLRNSSANWLLEIPPIASLGCIVLITWGWVFTCSRVWLIINIIINRKTAAIKTKLIIWRKNGYEIIPA